MSESGHLDPDRLAACLAAIAAGPELLQNEVPAFSLQHTSSSSSRPSQSMECEQRPSSQDVSPIAPLTAAAQATAAAAAAARAVAARRDHEACWSPWLRMCWRWSVPVALAVYILADKTGVFRSSAFTDFWCCGLHTTYEDIYTTDSFQQPLGRPQASLPPLVDLETADLAAVARRQLGSNSDSAGSEPSSDSHGHHPHEVMFFLIIMLIAGTLVTQILSFEIFRGVQQTVVLFFCGVTLSLILKGCDGRLEQAIGVWGRSYSMWMGIDSHLLLFTMLPPLVTGDAMAIDTHITSRVSKQCLYLAGPGVAIAGFSTALFLYIYLPYDWDFLLCLTAGAILCATDPVAVVALLKELGASPTLTVQIQGESLLNDGTAIVLYTIAYNMLSGEKYDAGDIIAILVQMAMYAWIVGSIIGYIFYKWIKLTHNKLDEHSSTMQVSLTIACAYSAFTVAEGWLKISGVLATVAAAGVLAHKMWPEITNRETMHTIWHMLEYLFNSIIFFLAGALSGAAMLEVLWMDYLHCIVIYLVITVIRGLLFFVSRPLLTQLHMDKAEVSIPDVAVMTWGGLRGAIGLALGIQVAVGRANDNVSQEDALRVLFYVSGVAALTLLINASTCPALVRCLGITQLPETKLKVLLTVHSQLVDLAKSSTIANGKVRKSLMNVLKDIQDHIVRTHITQQNTLGRLWDTKNKNKRRLSWLRKMYDQYSKPLPYPSTEYDMPYNKEASTASIEHATVAEILHAGDHGTKGVWQAGAGRISVAWRSENTPQLFSLQKLEEIMDLVTGQIEMMDSSQVINELRRRRIEVTDNDLIDMPHMPIIEQQEALISLLEKEECDPKIVRAINESFLGTVRSHYWYMIEQGYFYGGEAEQMLASLSVALSQGAYDLRDFDIIESFVSTDFSESDRNVEAAMSIPHKDDRVSAVPSSMAGSSSDRLRAKNSTVSARGTQVSTVSTFIEQEKIFIDSTFFTIMIFGSIVVNAIIVSVESGVRDDDDQGIGWLLAEIAFSAVFVVEFLLKLQVMRCGYFRSAGNFFDFILVILGILGCIFAIMVQIETADKSIDTASSEARMFRVAKTFRLVRVIRLFRLYRYWIALRSMISKRTIYLDVAETMQKWSMLRSFTKAHLLAQDKMIEYFGKLGKVDTVEVARCLLQSKTSVYKAVHLAHIQQYKLHEGLIENFHRDLEARAACESAVEFIIEAQKGGVLTSREAESMLHPLYDSIKNIVRAIKDIHAGYVEKDLARRPKRKSGILKQQNTFNWDDDVTEDVDRRRSEMERFTFQPSRSRVFEDEQNAFSEVASTSSDGLDEAMENSESKGTKGPPPSVVGRSRASKDEPAQEPSPEKADRAAREDRKKKKTGVKSKKTKQPVEQPVGFGIAASASSGTGSQPLDSGAFQPPQSSAASKPNQGIAKSPRAEQRSFPAEPSTDGQKISMMMAASVAGVQKKARKKMMTRTGQKAKEAKDAVNGNEGIGDKLGVPLLEPTSASILDPQGATILDPKAATEVSGDDNAKEKKELKKKFTRTKTKDKSMKLARMEDGLAENPRPKGRIRTWEKKDEAKNADATASSASAAAVNPDVFSG